MTDKNKGYFGPYGGAFVPDTLVSALNDIEAAYNKKKKEPKFQQELKKYLSDFVGRPTPLYKAKNLSEKYQASVYLKREDLAHTGAHKINNTVGQVLLAKELGKKYIIAETGAGQHGVATATAAANLGVKAIIFMGAVDYKRQALNVQRMQLLGADVRKVEFGSETLKEATTEAMRYWIEHVETSHYCMGSVLGPHPFPTIVRDFQRIIGDETIEQIRAYEGRLPDKIIACVGGGSNAMGIFYPFIPHKEIDLIAVEAAGEGLDSNAHAASLSKGIKGILHGSLNKILQSKTGQIQIAHSISAGLDYPGVGPELCQLYDTKRIKVAAITDKEAVAACKELSQLEGIIPALETAHAFAYLFKTELKNNLIVINLSGRGDKDLRSITASHV
ncbi:MAG: tryptophan synthase subunit beta [bacterium]